MKIINRLSSLIIVQMKCDTVGQGFHFLMPVEVNGITKDMIIRKNTPLHGGSAKDSVRGVPSPARKHANVFRSAFWEG